MSVPTSGRFRGSLSLLLGGLLLPACAVEPTRQPALSPSATVLPTPLVEQDELHECGLAALASLCGFYGVSISAAERLELSKKAAANQGLSGAELRTALEGLGFEVYLFEGTLDFGPTGLLHHIAEGRQLLVMTAEDDSHHYSLFIGHDPELANVVLLDPQRGRVLLPDESFEHRWSAVRRFTLLAVPRATDTTGARVSVATTVGTP